MSTWRTLLPAGLALAVSLLAPAAEPDCYYGDGKYTFGTILCQSGSRMQCRRDEQGRPVWASMEQQCDDPAAVQAAQPRSPSGGPGRSLSREEPASVRAPADRGDINAIAIQWAEYGRDGRTCDAGPAVAGLCAGRAACDVTVDPDTLCGDPLPGRSKLLSVYWSCGEGSQVEQKSPAYGQDDSTVELRCGS